MDRPYRAAFAASLGCSLLAGLLVAAIDAISTASAAQGASLLSLLSITLGLYALPVVGAGLAAGAVAGAYATTFGPGALANLLGHLGRDRALDRNVTAGLLAAAVALFGLVGVAAAAALVLVAGVERVTVGAVLTGAAVAAVLPVLAALALPLYRLARYPARLVPRVGPVPSAVVLLAASVLLAALAGFWFVTRRLDWRALNLGAPVLLAGFLFLFAAIGFLAYGPLARLRQRIPARGALVIAAGGIAILLVPLTLSGSPAPEVAMALGEHSKGARVLVSIGRVLRDSDGDGFSAFLGGPDCDDANAAVHPGADEIPGNGIDDNCLDGDRPALDAAAAPGAAGDTGADPLAAAPATERRADNLVLIAIDTLRADRLGIAGYQRDGKSLTPRIDRFAGQGSTFTRAYAQAPNTPRSFPSIHASRHPSQLKFNKDFQNYPDPLDENLFLFEVLQSAGLRTEGIASHFYFDRAPGFRQGFDSFDNEGAKDIAGSNKDIASPRIVPKVEARLAELSGKKERFALFVHLFEPHSTYVAHEEFPITETGVPALVQKYDYEIAYVDQWLGRILDAIEKNGLDESTLVIVVSDHGEAFGVHRIAGKKMFFHGQTLYDELLRVPLLVRLPGIEPSSIADPVSLLDLAPTVLDGLGIPIPNVMLGRSLVARMNGQPLDPLPVFAQLLPAPSWDQKWMAIVAADGKHKLIYRVSERSFELYDLSTDPEEQVDLYRIRPDLAKQLREQLTRWIEVDLAQ